MAGDLLPTLINLKSTTRSLTKQAAKAKSDHGKEEEKLAKAMKAGNIEIAKIYASNVARKETEHLNLTRLASQLDAITSRVQTAVTMQRVAKSMDSVNVSMARALKGMDVSQMQAIMDRFETQFDDVDVAASYYETATGSTTAVGAPQEKIDALMRKHADAAGVDLQSEMTTAETPQKISAGPTDVEEDGLGQRLRALRS